MTIRLFDVIHALRVLREKSPHGVYVSVICRARNFVRQDHSYVGATTIAAHNQCLGQFVLGQCLKIYQWPSSHGASALSDSEMPQTQELYVPLPTRMARYVGAVISGVA